MAARARTGQSTECHPTIEGSRKLHRGTSRAVWLASRGQPHQAVQRVESSSLVASGRSGCPSREDTALPADGSVRHYEDMPELPEPDRAILLFEEKWGSRLTGPKEVAILSTFGWHAARYQQRLHSIIGKPAAAAEMPELVKRLQRLQERRTRARAARTFT